jgi:hypothetical protein
MANLKLSASANMVGKLVEAPCYTPEGCRFNFRSGHWIFFTLHNPSSHNIAQELTQPLTEMSTRNLTGGGVNVKSVHKANKLTNICDLTV